MIGRLLISPGMARSGTTYLYSQFAAQNKEFFNTPRRKENNFFVNSCSVPEFKELFPSDFDGSKYSIDYSPGYFASPTNWLENMLKFPAAKKKIIIHLRNPVDQMFAHYLHDVKSHLAKREYGDDVDRPFFRINVLKRYLAKRADVVRRLVSELGSDNVLALNFHKEIPSTPETTPKIARFLDLPLKPFSSQVVGPGGWTPHYVYGGSNGLNIAIGLNIRRVPARALLLVNSNETMIWDDVEPGVASKLIAGSSSWTREILPEQFDSLYSYLRDDWIGILEALNQDESDYKVDTHLKSRNPFCNEVGNTLTLQSDIGSILPKASFTI